MDHRREVDVRVQVVPLDDGRQIGWGANLTEALSDRLDDVRAAVAAGAGAVAGGLPELPGASGWEVAEVSSTFGMSLTAGAGVILSTASAEATFEVTITFHRTEPRQDGEQGPESRVQPAGGPER